MTHNGETYNCRELRKELIGNGEVSFQSDSDTEVIINGYECWGDEALNQLRGMFAFALFDNAASRLLLAREELLQDRCGRRENNLAN